MGPHPGVHPVGRVQAVVSKSEMSGSSPTTPPRSPREGLGAASSSCSYAAVALARSLFRKGATFTAAIAFEIASTNLVIELGIILALLMGWQFALRRVRRRRIMIVLLALLFRLLAACRLSRRRAAGRARRRRPMEGHAAMDMSVTRRLDRRGG